MKRDRCAFCGAMNAAEAEWCGMCLRRFPPPEIAVEAIESPADLLFSDQPPTSTAAGVGSPTTQSVAEQTGDLEPKERGAFTVTEAGISWSCSRCETKNPLDAEFCSVCGTSFAEVVRPKVERPERDPNMAAMLSLFFPGAGHAYVGLIGQAIARGVISLWVVGVVAMALFAGGKSNSSAVGAVFGLVATMLWVLAAHDAYREARNEPSQVILKGKFFLYLVMGLVAVLFALLVGAGLNAR